MLVSGCIGQQSSNGDHESITLSPEQIERWDREIDEMRKTIIAIHDLYIHACFTAYLEADPQFTDLQRYEFETEMSAAIYRLEHCHRQQLGRIKKYRPELRRLCQANETLSKEERERLMDQFLDEKAPIVFVE